MDSSYFPFSSFFSKSPFLLWDLSLLIVLVLVPIVVYGTWHVGFFKRRGIKCCDDILPIVGHMYSTMAMKEHIRDVIVRTYSRFPDEKYVGHMQFNVPMIMLRDPELIKQANIRDFDHFEDHVVIMTEEGDNILGNFLFSLKGERWREMRATLSPVFSNSKVKGMFDFVCEAGQQMADYYVNEMKNPIYKEKGMIEIEMKEAFTRYANDVIASSIFGIRVNSLEQKDNEFFEIGKITSPLTGVRFIKYLLMCSFPKFTKLIGINCIENSVRTFFQHIVLNTMKEREEKGIVRTDMLHLLHEARKGSLKHEANQKTKDAGYATVQESSIGLRSIRRNWTDDEIVSQAVLFFITGYDTISTLLSFLFHELATNMDVQRKLQNEIDEEIAMNGKKLNYNNLVKMNYLDMVLSETLRKWPPAVSTDRLCIKPYKLPPTNGNNGYTVQPGEGLWIPIYGIHHDPKYYPNPEKFDPERFSEENKSKIQPMTFIPFGVGPRNCIGSKFALMETKAIVFHMLANFNFVPTENTQPSIVLKKSSFSLHSEKGFYVGLEPRF